MKVLLSLHNLDVT